MAGWTQSDVDKLRAAVASGVKTVEFDGPPRRSTTFHDLKDMRALLAEMVADVATANGTRQAFRLAATSKGLIDGGAADTTASGLPRFGD